MSTSVEYFFGSEKDLHELSAEINEWLGCDLRVSEVRPGREQSWCKFFGMSLDFYAHSLENDRNGDDVCDFESFKYHIGFAGPKDIRLSTALPLTVLVAYLLYCRLDIKNGLLTFDVQLLVARYEERLSDGFQYLFDTVSNKPVEFPQHFVDIQSRIPEWAY
jgi:hypothetical protein